MGLLKACWKLRKVIAANHSFSFHTYLYTPNRFDVTTLRRLNSPDSRLKLSQAEAANFIHINENSHTRISRPKEFSIRQWFVALGEAVANSFNVTR